MKRYIKAAKEENVLTKAERMRLFGEDPQGRIVIPGRYTEIGNFAFDGCHSLKSVEIPNSVICIGYEAFYGCNNLMSIRIPDSVTSIDGFAFGSCDSLKSITLPNSITFIDSCAFSGCTSLTDIRIPDSVTMIDNQTFENCKSLTTITIPASVTSIGDWAFSGCTNLTEVNFEGDVNSINVSRNAFLDTPIEGDIKNLLKLDSDSYDSTGSENTEDSSDTDYSVVDFDKIYRVDDYYEGGELPDVIEGPFSTLSEACQFYHDYNEDVYEVLQSIDYDFGNDVGVFPLNVAGDWSEQQQIYLDWLKLNYPEEFSKFSWDNY